MFYLEKLWYLALGYTGREYKPTIVRIPVLVRWIRSSIFLLKITNFGTADSYNSKLCLFTMRLNGSTG